MSYSDIINAFPNIYKLTKVWYYNYDELLFFGSNNASGRLRITTDHDLNYTTDRVTINQQNNLFDYLIFRVLKFGMTKKIPICLNHFRNI